jgi:uncharacterized protein YbjT (DUF2867 family)
MHVLLFGATGMVGQGVLLECLRDARATRVTAVGRTPLEHEDTKLEQRIARDLFAPDSFLRDLPTVDACFFCLGVSSAGLDEAAYRRVTQDLTLAVARPLAAANAAMAFVYVSGAGTDSTERGRTMWARVKGATENALLALPFRAFAFRPGIIQPLDGIVSKTASYRWFYVVAGPFLSLARSAFPRHVLTTAQMGRAMIAVAADGYPSRVLEAADIARAAGSHADSPGSTAAATKR